MPDDPVKLLRAWNGATGLVLHARTAIPSWLGEGLNVGYAIDVLHPLARSTSWYEELSEQKPPAATMYREMDMRFWLEKAEAETRALG